MAEGQMDLANLVVERVSTRDGGNVHKTVTHCSFYLRHEWAANPVHAEAEERSVSSHSATAHDDAD